MCDLPIAFSGTLLASYWRIVEARPARTESLEILTFSLVDITKGNGISFASYISRTSRPGGPPKIQSPRERAILLRRFY